MTREVFCIKHQHRIQIALTISMVITRGTQNLSTLKPCVTMKLNVKLSV